VVCGSAATVGIGLGGMNGIAVALVATAAGVVLLAHLFAPSEWRDQPPPPGKDERGFLAGLVFKAFLLRTLVSLALHATDGWQYFGGDEGTFDGTARVFSLWVKGELPFNLSAPLASKAEVAYPYLLGALYYTFGWSKVVPLLLNAVVGASLVYPVHALAGRFAGREAARRAATLVAWFPSLVLWSALMVRDAWVLLFLISALYLVDRARRKLTAANLLGVGLCLAGIATTRNYVFSVVAVAIAAGLVLGRGSTARSLFLGSLSIVGLIALLRSGGDSGLDSPRATLEAIALQRNLNSMGPSVSGSLGLVDISTPTAALTYLPLGLLFFLFSPLPWQIRSTMQVAAIADLLLWYSLMPAILAGLVWLVRKRLRAALPLLLAVVGISVLYALVEGNIGIIFRHRAQIIVPLCAVAGVGYALKRRAARKESRLLERPLPVHAPPVGPLRPAPGVRVP